MTDTNAVREAVTLSECPPGLFMFNGHLGLKTEYGMAEVDEKGAEMPGTQVRWVIGSKPDAYVAASGECFWGGANTHAERAALLVQPVDADAILALLATDRAAGVGDEEVLTISREPTEAMMQAGLYQSSHDSSWSDVHSIWKAMFDAVAEDGGCTTHLPAASPPAPADASGEVEACARIADGFAEHATRLMSNGGAITDERVAFLMAAEQIAAAIRARGHFTPFEAAR